MITITIRKFITVLVFIIILTALKAQQTVTTNGGDAGSNGTSVSFSIGQIVYTTNSGENGSEQQGVIQPYEISVVTSVKDIGNNITNQSLDCTVFPNPTANKLTLKIAGDGLKNIHYQLFNINGKLIETKNIENNETIIFMGERIPATYILKIVQNKNEVKTFKIIKK